MENQGQKVIVSAVNIQFDVPLPKEMMPTFIRMFKEEFDTPDFSFGVRGRSFNCVRTTVPFSQKQKFYDFVGRFCRENQLEFIIKMDD